MTNWQWNQRSFLGWGRAMNRISLRRDSKNENRQDWFALYWNSCSYEWKNSMSGCRFFAKGASWQQGRPQLLPPLCTSTPITLFRFWPENLTASSRWKIPSSSVNLNMKFIRSNEKPSNSILLFKAFILSMIRNVFPYYGPAADAISRVIPRKTRENLYDNVVRSALISWGLFLYAVQGMPSFLSSSCFVESVYH